MSDEISPKLQKGQPVSWHHTCKALRAESWQGIEVDVCPYCGTLQKASKRKKEAKNERGEDAQDTDA